LIFSIPFPGVKRLKQFCIIQMPVPALVSTRAEADDDAAQTGAEMALDTSSPARQHRAGTNAGKNQSFFALTRVVLMK